MLRKIINYRDNPAFFANLLVYSLGSIIFLGIVYRLYKALSRAPEDSVVFPYVWLAGHMWSNGQNPYSVLFKQMGAEIFPKYSPTFWFYPPNWFFPSSLVALFDTNTGSIIWQAANVILLIISCAVVALAFKKIIQIEGFKKTISDLSLTKVDPFLLIFVFVAFYMILSNPTALTLGLGQTSIIIFLGLSILMYGLISEKKWLPVIGLTILMLKPQVGLIFSFALIMEPSFRHIVIKAAVATIIMCLPAFFFTTIPEMAAYYAAHFAAEYKTYVYNRADLMTGINNFTYSFFTKELGSALTLFFALIVTIVGMVTLTKVKNGEETELKNTQHKIAVLSFALAICMFVMPLHTYDLVIIGGIIPLMLYYRGIPLILLIVGTGLIWRSKSVALLLGVQNNDAAVTLFKWSAGICSLGATLILAGVVLYLFRIHRPSWDDIKTSFKDRLVLRIA